MVNENLCDTPSVDFSHDSTAQIGKFPEDALKASREFELKNMLDFDVFELMEELPAKKQAHDMVWVDEWRGDRVRSRLCVRQFRAEGLWDDLFAGTPDTFFIKYLLAKAASCKDLGILVIDISVAFMHARIDEEICVKVPSGIKSSNFWRVKTAVNGTRKASKQWQEYSSDKLVKSLLFRENDISPCMYKRFSENLDLEQHDGGFLVCGLSSDFECCADEFNKHFRWPFQDSKDLQRQAALQFSRDGRWTREGDLLEFGRLRLEEKVRLHNMKSNEETIPNN